MGAGRRKRRQAAAIDAALASVREELEATRAEIAVLSADAAAQRRAAATAADEPEREVTSEPSSAATDKITEAIADKIASEIAPPPPAPPAPVAADPEMLATLGALTRACELVAAELRAERHSRSALTDAVANLTALLAAGSAPVDVPRRSTVVGGSVAPTTPDEIVLDGAGEAPRDGVEVRCRFGDHWVSGFDVVDVVEDAGETRYRLRRRSDGCVLPAVFAAADVRFFTTAPTIH